ncbi:MAG TPA: hypothetical protein VFA30_06355 [Gaiellaceae bacterium]|nr:hypothetical protein [Gaiellaceae bacterium]
MTRWVAPVGDQLRLLVLWLEPVLSRPGLEQVPADELCIELGAAEAPAPFEPFDALVGPVRMEREGVVAEVIPREAFEAIVPGARPQVVFARSDGSVEHDPFEFVASEAVVVSAVVAA